MRWYWSLKLGSLVTWISSLSKPAHRPMRSRFSMTPTSSRPELRTSVFGPASWKISGCWARTCAMAVSTCFWKFAPSAGQLPMSLVWMGSLEQLLEPGKLGAGSGVAVDTGTGEGELTAVGVSCLPHAPRNATTSTRYDRRCRMNPSSLVGAPRPWRYRSARHASIAHSSAVVVPERWSRCSDLHPGPTDFTFGWIADQVRGRFVRDGVTGRPSNESSTSLLGLPAPPGSPGARARIERPAAAPRARRTAARPARRCFRRAVRPRARGRAPAPRRPYARRGGRHGRARP